MTDEHDTSSVEVGTEELWSRPLPDPASLGVGPALRQRREALGWDVEAVAQWLRIRPEYLDALENGDPAALPSGAYALGFLRTYAGSLGFDPDVMVAHFRKEARAGVQKPELLFPAPVGEKTVPASVIIFLGVMVLIGAYAAWYHYMGRDVLPVQTIPSVARVMPGVSGHAQPSPQIASVMPASKPSSPSPSPSPSAAIPPSSVAKPEIVPKPSAPVSTMPSPPVQETVPVQTAENVVQSNPVMAGDEKEAAIDAPPMAGQGLQLRASGQAWVQVRNADGKVIYDHLFRAGEVWDVPPECGDACKLTVGNAGGLQVAGGGVVSPPLGRPGAVRRNLPLTLAAVQNGTLLDVPTADNVHSVKPTKPVQAKPASGTSADDLNARQLSGGSRDAQ
ncbi:MAG: RodZ domain-containing protein [Acetobacter sp.]|jgi:cytoskeleton protein RodZ